LRAIFFYVILH